MLQLIGLKKSYGNHLVVDVPHYVMHQNIYWLKGLNGSGKTTLMKVLAGLLPFEGEVVLHKVSLKKQRTNYLRLINYAEAEPLYPSFLTGKDLVDLYVRTKKPEAGQADELLNLLKVNEYVLQPIGTYSSGMKKKLSIALAFIGKPRCILLDEPLATVDDASVPLILQLIDDFHKKQGVTFILTSHQNFDESVFTIGHKLQMKDKTIMNL